MIVEQAHNKRLKEYNINIKTKYKSENNFLERNSDNSRNDNIINGIVLEKEYYRDNKLLKVESKFDSRILYTYIYALNDEDKYKCPNCGMNGIVKDFKEGCPYCGTHYNIDYLEKDLGGKHYYDLIVNKTCYKIQKFIRSFILSFIISFTFIKLTSRTFLMFDIIKVIIGTILIGLLLFYLFYYIDQIFIMPSIQRKKEEENEQQRIFWNSMSQYNISKEKFYNNINYNLREYYYSNKNPNVIDFDILDYIKFEEENKKDLIVKVTIEMRIVRIINNKIISKCENNTFEFKYVSSNNKISGGINIIKCPNCGSSIDVREQKCTYCDAPHNYFQEWYLLDE